MNAIEVKDDAYPVLVRIVSEYASYGHDENALAMVEVRGQLIRPVNTLTGIQVEVVYVIDTSGSMDASIDIVNSALQFVCQSTPEHYSVSIITFNEEAFQYWTMSKMTSVVKQQLNNRTPLKAEGYTNIAQGLYQGMSQFTSPRSASEHDNIQRIMVLLSDGQPTHGPRSLTDILQVCRRHPTFAHVQIITIAMGTEVDRQLLTQLSMHNNGKMYFVQTVDELPRAFGDCLGTLLTLSASRMIIEIQAEQSIDDLRVASTSTITSRSTIQYESSSQRQLTFNVGALYEGEQRNVLLDIPACVPSIVVSIRFIDAATGEPCTIERRFIIPRNDTTTIVAQPRIRNQDVAIQLLRTEGQRIVTQCANSGQNDGLEALSERIRREGLEEHPVGKCLLDDIQCLQALFRQAQEELVVNVNSEVDELPLLSQCLQPRSVSMANYVMACATTSVGMATQSPASGTTALRRQLSSECILFSQRHQENQDK
jgi:Mg-chelatase subunit ChlD